MGRRAAAVTGTGRVDRDDLLARVDLERLLDALTGTSATRQRRWHCPDQGHPDEHPSVSVHVAADGVQRWRCWSGGHGGTAIDAVIAARGGDIGEAMRWLADHYANLPVIERPPAPPPAPLGRPDQAVVDYAQRAAQLLWTPAGQTQRAWLAARGLHEPVLRANQVGADPGRRWLARRKGLPRGWPAVVYPSLDRQGRVTYVQARYLEPVPGRSKYDNPAGPMATNPRLAWTRPVGEPRPGVVVICEGTADALIAAQAGFRSVGVLGAAYPDERIADRLVRVREVDAEIASATIVICFDADQPGRHGADRLINLLVDREVSAVSVTPPEGCDLTTWAATTPDWSRHLPATATPPTPQPTVTPQDPSVGPVLPPVAEWSLEIS